jgi:hypothetical protein
MSDPVAHAPVKSAFVMHTLIKAGVVLAGYAAAVVAASVALEIRLEHTQGPDVQASAGMYAFGDFLLFVAVFSSVAIVPTGLALFFLRPLGRLWAALSFVAVAIAVTGVAAMWICILGSRVANLAFPWVGLEALAVLRMFAAPLLAASFAVAVFIAPNWTSRWALVAAAVMEGAVALYTVFHWFIGPCFI